jgi:hypothetical protein
MRLASNRLATLLRNFSLEVPNPAEGQEILDIQKVDPRVWTEGDIEVRRRRMLYRAKQTGWLETDIMLVMVWCCFSYKFRGNGRQRMFGC